MLGRNNMPSAIRVHEAGGPEKLIWEEVEVGAPGSIPLEVPRDLAIPSSP
jgi:hypothetical protein